MKRGKLELIFIIILFGILSISFVSASWFSDFFGKITGRATTTTEPAIVTINSFNAPFEYKGGTCVKDPVKISNNFQEGNLIKVTDSKGSLCARYYPRPGNCKSTQKKCIDTGRPGASIECNNTLIKFGFYDDTKNPQKLINEYTVEDMKKGVAAPKGANSLYTYYRDSKKSNYFDDNGAFSCTYEYTVTSCTPDCTNKQCGDNGCGGSCGICDSSSSCSQDGICIPIVTCSDSDNGLSYYVFGKTSLNPGGIKCEDECSNINALTLNECSCTGSSIYNCLFGCQDGACIRQKIISIEKLNDINTNDMAKISVKTSEDDGTVASQDKGWYLVANLDGTNFNSSYDSDYGLWYIHFVAPDKPGRYNMEVTLYCSRENSICWNLTKGNGYEWKENVPIDVSEKPGACSDSDEGLDYYVKGIATGTDPSIPTIKNYSYEDHCINNLLYEASCDGEYVISTAYKCPNGCSDGACIKENVCTDSDGGNKRYIKGKTCLGNNCEIDNCTRELRYPSCKGEDCFDEIIREYYCEKSDYTNNIYEYISDATYRCTNGCTDGACNKVIVDSDVCTDIVDLVANPDEIDIYGIKYSANGWNYNGKNIVWINNIEYNVSEYSASWSTYQSNNYDNKYSYENAWINARIMVADDATADMSWLAKDRLTYNVCQVRNYWDSNDKENIVYICNWDALNNKQSLDNYQYKSRQIIWSNNNIWVELQVDFGKSLTEEEINKIARETVNEFLNDLKDNQNRYVDWSKFDVPYLASNFIRYFITNCNSNLKEPIRSGTDNETCYPSWDCKIEPIVCPEYGYQKRICRDYSCNQQREEQVSCSPGICSGCYVPRWFEKEFSMDNICIPYGIRFSQPTSTMSQKLVEYTEDERIKENYQGDYILEIKSENEATLILFDRDGKNYTYILIPNEKIIVNIPGWSEEFVIYTKDIIINGDEKYVDITIYVKRYEYVRENINAYCDFDGVVKKQKTTDQEGNWAKCQNNYECQSNFCSDGECIEAMKMIKEASQYKVLGIKILCRFANLFNIEKYNECVKGKI